MPFLFVKKYKLKMKTYFASIECTIYIINVIVYEHSLSIYTYFIKYCIELYNNIEIFMSEEVRHFN